MSRYLPGIPSGGAGGGGGGSVTQTTRDAHVIVVGQSSAPYNDVAAITCDYADPGDGTGLEAALTAAQALVTAGYDGVDVRLRPCNIIVDPTAVAAVPFTVPQGVRVIGASGVYGLSSLVYGSTGANGTSQTIFSVGAEGSLEDLHLYSPTADAAVIVSNGLVELAGRGRVSRCRIDLVEAGANRLAYTAIFATAPNGVLIEDCDVNLPTGSLDATGVQLGNATTFTRCAQPPEVRNYRQTGGGGGLKAINVDNPVFTNVDLRDLTSPQAALLHYIFVSPGDSNPIEAMKVRGAFIEVNTADARDCYGILMVTAVLDAIYHWQVDDVVQEWGDVGAAPSFERSGVKLQCGGANFRWGTVSNVMCRALGSNALQYGLYIDASGAQTVEVDDVAVSSFMADQAYAYGAYLRCDLTGSIYRTTFLGCRFSDAVTAGIGVQDVNVFNTIIVANQLHNTVIADAGTGTEQAHNLF